MPYKVVAIGDSKCGKTSLILSYLHTKFPEAYTPTMYDHYATDSLIDGKRQSVDIWDTSGEENMDSIRPMCYGGAHVFLLCFSVTSRSSLENLKRKWAPMIRVYVPDATIILVGCKIDLRSTPASVARLERKGTSAITQAEAQAYVKDVGAAQYIECSAITQDGVKDLFNHSIKAAMAKQQSRSKCVIL